MFELACYGDEHDAAAASCDDDGTQTKSYSLLYNIIACVIGTIIILCDYYAFIIVHCLFAVKDQTGNGKK